MIILLPNVCVGDTKYYVNPTGPAVLVWGDKVKQVDEFFLADLVRNAPDDTTFAKFSPEHTKMLRKAKRLYRRKVNIEPPSKL